MIKTNIEMDPPSGGNCGWGLHDDPINHRLFKERIEAESCESIGVFEEMRNLVAAKGSDSPMEELVKSRMPYDDGWDCDYVDKLLYNGTANVNQGSVGSCVGAGSASAVASKIATEILIEGDLEHPFGLSLDASGRNTSMQDQCIPFVGYHYGAAKTKDKWNGEKFTGTGWCSDGSYCSIQIWALKTTGILPCSEVENFKKGPQSDDVRSWGCNRRGELNNHLHIGQKYLMKDSSRVKSGDDLWDALAVLKRPCMICSGWAFAPQDHVDGLGYVYRKQGSWAHNLTLSAAVEVKGNRYVKVRNQWGPNAHKDGWYFWIPLELADRWMKDAECQTIGDFDLKDQGLPTFPVLSGTFPQQ